MRLAPCLIATVLATPAAAQAPDFSSASGRVYDTVRGWVVVQSPQLGCSAYVEGSPLVFNAPPAGGWQLVLAYTTAAGEGQFEGSIDVDRYSFDGAAYGDGSWMYVGFPLNLRQAIGQGDRLFARIGPMSWELTLGGTTAALLKVEECWADLTGWRPGTSTRAGTFAFSGD